MEMTLSPSIQELLRGLNILVVYDAALIRILLKETLVFLGADAQIDEAANGLQAWNLLQETSYGLVIADIMMPHMDGLKLQRRVRRSHQHREIPFLLISGEAFDKTIKSALQSQRDYFLNKPFSIEVLKRTLWEILRQV